MDLVKRSDKAILKVADLIMDDLLIGAIEGNYEKHTRHFDNRMKRAVSKEYFKKVFKHYQAGWGYFAKRECVAIFRRPESVAIVWRQGCTKQVGELVAELVLVETDTRYLVSHAMVY
jgi:hypothetical protein